MAKLYIAISVVALALAGCFSTGRHAEDASRAPTSGMETPTTASTHGSGVAGDPPGQTGGEAPPPENASGGHDHADPEVARLVEAAVADLMTRMSVKISAISVYSVKWDQESDTCPNSEIHRIQTELEGAAIELAIGGSSFWYRQTGPGEVQLCVDNGSPASGPGSHLIPPTTTP